MLLPSILSDAAAQAIGLLEHGDAGTTLRESTGGCQTADATANYDDVRRLQCFSTREGQCEVHRSACCDRFGEPHVSGSSTARIHARRRETLNVTCQEQSGARFASALLSHRSVCRALGPLPICCCSLAPIVITLLPRCAPPAKFWAFVKVTGEPRSQLLGTGHPCRASLQRSALPARIQLSELTRRRAAS